MPTHRSKPGALPIVMIGFDIQLQGISQLLVADLLLTVQDAPNNQWMASAFPCVNVYYFSLGIVYFKQKGSKPSAHKCVGACTHAICVNHVLNVTLPIHIVTLVSTL